VDLSIFKNFAISERWRVEFRTEFFNAFNRANFNNPSASIAAASLPSFGKSLSTVGDPREIQFALKLYF
jgi:nucleoside recognition membrane protein YjiH